MDRQSGRGHRKLQAFELHVDELGYVVLFKISHIGYVLDWQHQKMVFGLRVLVRDDYNELVRVQHEGGIVHGQDQIVA